MQYNFNPQSSEHPQTCDFHVHVGEVIGGHQLADDFESLSRKAEQAGVVAIGAFVTEEINRSLKAKYQAMKEMAIRVFSGHVHWHLTPVKADFDEVSELCRQGCDIKFYTTYKEAGLFRSYEEIEMWMLAIPDVRFLVHCEDDSIIQRHSIRQPFRRPFDHCKRRPEQAEIVAVEKILNLAIKNRHPVHIVHVSSPQAALLIKEAKKDWNYITCETAPHYLIFNEDRLKETQGHRYLCSPPYRSEASRGLLVELLQDGVFDIIASDHCPFSDELKDRYKDTPASVPNGIAGMHTLYGSMYDSFVKTGKITASYLYELCYSKPALLMGIQNGSDTHGS